MKNVGIECRQIAHGVCALSVGEEMEVDFPVSDREIGEGKAIANQTSFDLPNCFDMMIVEDFVITGDEVNIIATGDRNDNPIGRVFVKVTWELGAGDRI